MAWRPRFIAGAIALALASSVLESTTAEATKDILLDTDVDVDDIFAIVYLLKQKKWGINLKAITISANAWSDAGHAINHVYDVLHMMGRDDIPVGVGGEGGITFKGHIFPNVGGYLPLIEQMLSTSGGCRYRQAIPPGQGGLLDVDTMYGLRKQFLPQGERHYVPIKQPTAQEVMLNALLSGPTTVILIGSHTNFAALLMTHPEVKHNVEHIYIMGGGVNSSNPTGCCQKDSVTSCVPGQCRDRGNLFDAVDSNPWAEFNIFSDPFAAYQVFHSGIPITLVPLDATNTIPLTKNFFSFLETNQGTFEAQYIYQSLKMVRDTWFDDQFYQSYFMWDSFTSGIAVSDILNNHNIEANAFAVISIKDVTVVTSNKPYGIQDGSNPFFDNRTIPKFHLLKGSVHSGHVQTGLQDPFCLVPNGKGKCMDGYTMEISGPEAVRMQVGQKAKPNSDVHINLEFAFFKSFIESLNDSEDTAHYNFETQFPCYKEVLYKPKYMGKQMGKALIFDMDMSPGDFITLFYLLKTPRELIDLKAITVTATGWANAATIDIVYDVLHMMGRDDIPVGLGEYFANGQAYAPFNSTGDCRYRQSIPNGSGGLIDSDTLFGLARDLPRSPRRYTAHNSVTYGAPRNTEYPKLRQPLAQEVLKEVLNGLDKSSKVTILTGGPVTNIAKLLASNASFKSSIKELYITGGSIHENHLSRRNAHLGNVFTVPQNIRAEFNMFLDPMAAEEVFQAGVKVILIPLDARRGVTLSMGTIKKLEGRKTAEAAFVHNLLLTIHRLQMHKKIYKHTAKLAGGEALAAAVMADRVRKKLRGEFGEEAVRVVASGDIAVDGWTQAGGGGGGGWRRIEYVKSIDIAAYKEDLVEALNRGSQSAVVSSFAAQTHTWRTCQS